MTKIGNYAFRDCTSLTSIEIPDGVTNIGNYAFYNCTALTEINYNATECEDLSSGGLFYNAGQSGEGITVHIGENVTKIPAYLFYPYYKLSYENSSYSPKIVSVVFAEDSQCEIRSYAFYECTSLTNVTIPNGVTSIGNYAFDGCTSLQSVTIGSGVKNIESYAFQGCEKLIEVYDLSSSLNITVGSENNGYVAYYAKYVHHSTDEPSKFTTTNDGYIFYGDATSGCYLVGYTGNETSLTLPVDHEGNNYGIYNYAFYNCTSLTSVTIPNGVTSIGNYAFDGCTSLESVTIGSGVTDIGNYAFYNCTSLESITIGSSVKSIGYGAFKYCTSLEIVTIGNGVTSIGSSAFSGCTSLTSVTIGSGVTSIGNDAFSGCSSLAGVYITDTEAWCKISFGNSAANPLYYAGNLYLDNKLVTGLIISANLTTIGQYAFYNCKSLTSVTINGRVTSIGTSAFEGCYKLIEVKNLSSYVTLTKGNTSNGYVAYYAKNVYTSSVGTTKLTTTDGYIFYDDTENENGYYLMGYTGTETELTLPDYHNDKNYGIYQYAFCGCTSLTSVTIGSGVTDIGDWAFSGCTSLTEIIVPDGVTNIGERAFYGCTSLTSVTIGSGVTSIGYEAFRDCTSLTSIEIPDGVTSIGGGAFSRCTSLTSVTIGSGVESIGSYAFYNCTSLTSVTIPDSVTSILYQAFEYCSSLESVYYNGTADEWSKISIGSSNDYLKNATRYYYSESEPTTDGNYWHYDTDGVTPVVWEVETATDTETA